ncbi:hypothetical protein YC2023_065974 [Brassica napus]
MSPDSLTLSSTTTYRFWKFNRIPFRSSNSAGGLTRPVKARSISPTEETSRPVLTKGGPGDPSQAVSQAPSPESNPNSPSPVTTMVGHYPTIES